MNWITFARKLKLERAMLVKQYGSVLDGEALSMLVDAKLKKSVEDTMQIALVREQQYKVARAKYFGDEKSPKGCVAQYSGVLSVEDLSTLVNAKLKNNFEDTLQIAFDCGEIYRAARAKYFGDKCKQT